MALSRATRALPSMIALAKARIPPENYPMKKRALGQFSINPIGLGCMGFSHGYGPKTSGPEAERAIVHAIDSGYDFLDTAVVYGMGHNEELVGRAIKGRRDKIVLASKCGLKHTAEGQSVSGDPAVLLATLEDSLRRLDVDHIDLYYIHRPDRTVPIEDSIAALAGAVKAGKIGAIGLSEVSADWLRVAAAVHPIAALQTEYSLWTRNPEIAVLDACRELGTTFVAFSPVARGFLAGGASDPARFGEGDMRKVMPRFQEPNLSRNLALLDGLRAIGADLGATPAQLCLAWLLHIDPDLVTIPGTTSIAHMDENMAANDLALSAADMARLDALINKDTVSGPRYPPAMQASVMTEEFA